MIVSELCGQTWTLTKKELLLVARRRWFSTFIRAVAFPIVLTVILASVKTWIHNDGGYGIGAPSPVRTLREAFDYIGGTRKNFVIVDRGLQGADVRAVIDELSQMARDGGRDVQTVSDSRQLRDTCPSSSKGVTNCFGAVDFWSSPDQGPNAIWNYTIWQDSVIGGADVRSNANGPQLYTIPLQRAVDSMISRRNNGTVLPDTIMQYPFTSQTQQAVDFRDDKFFGLLITQALGFALFLAMCGIAYHLTGHVVWQREAGLLQLIDAQMPNTSRWECLAARMFATHLAFDIVYMPAWIICGAVVGTIVYPHSNAGWFVLLYVMAGLAMTSFSILASSLFRRQQLSAISAVVAAIAFAIVAQFSQSGQKSTQDAAVYATGLLFPPSSFVYFLVSGAVSEIFSQPLRPHQQIPSLLGGLLDIKVWSLTPAHFLGFFAFQIALYPILAIVVERFLWGSSFRGRHLRSAPEMAGNALRINKFSKRYNGAAKKKDRTLAVEELSLDVYAGTIMVLLGQNGCGKSTTLSCIAGLESITEGTIELDGTGGVGLCPQKNVMWPDMTVEEHVRFFEHLKKPSCKPSQAEVDRLVDGCDLKKKTHALSKTLSGGQQRKLQLCMMLAGGSRVCCIDEASSGVDPLARRKIWDILLRERGTRTLLLTTHFLDESEVLADNIALMSKGKLRAQGTVASLKTSHGDGYRITSKDNITATSGLTSGLEVTTGSQGNGVTSFHAADSAALSQLLARLDQRGHTDYQIDGPSIEKIFLSLADEMQPTKIETHDKRAIDHSTTPVSGHAMVLHTGKGSSRMRQTWIIFRKRITILKHNFMPYVAALFVPLVVAGLVTRFLLNVESYGLQCREPGTSYYGSYYVSKPQSLSPYSVAATVMGPSVDRNLQNRLQALMPNATFYTNGTISSSGFNYFDRTTSVQSFSDFNTTINNNIADNANGYFPGGFYLDDNGTPIFAWLADGGNYYPENFQLLGMMDMALTNTSVAVSYDNFEQGYAPRDFFQSLVAVFTTLGFVLFPGLFALYPTRERLQKVRAMHYSNGISSGPLWAAYALFDFCWLLLIAILVTVIWLANGYAWYGLGYMFLVFLFYGMASTAYSYIISLFAPSQLAAIAMTCIVQVVIAMLFFVGCFLTVAMADLSVIYRNLEILYYTIGLICPAVSLLRALLVVTNVYAISCDGAALAAYPGGINLYGGPILYLLLQFIFFVLFLIYWESGRSLEAFGISWFSRSSKSPKDAEKDIDSGSDIIEEHDRLSSANNGLRVAHVSKTFKDNKAVDDVSFGIMPSEKFALLGPNGAGKSTMISLIRGDLSMDSSSHNAEIHISGDNLVHSPVAAKQHLGVCPQFDAVDSMTLKEHLEFYARARGLSSKEKNENITEIINRLGLRDHANKLVKKLSGGTKRKLSLGIALVGNPSVLLLDEPSSGMDAAAKRALWSTLTAISEGRSLLITTHSMEEGDALCDRAGIMAGRMLALGTIDSLHERFSDKVYVHLVHHNAPRSTPEEMESLWGWVRSTFLVAETEKSVGGQARFAVPIARDPLQSAQLLDGSHMGKLFQTIEAHKEQEQIRDYSIGHATLDQVFINVCQGVDEENSEHVRRGGLLSRVLGRKK